MLPVITGTGKKNLYSVPYSYPNDQNRSGETKSTSRIIPAYCCVLKKAFNFASVVLFLPVESERATPLLNNKTHEGNLIYSGFDYFKTASAVALMYQIPCLSVSHVSLRKGASDLSSLLNKVIGPFSLLPFHNDGNREEQNTEEA